MKAGQCVRQKVVLRDLCNAQPWARFLDCAKRQQLINSLTNQRAIFFEPHPEAEIWKNPALMLATLGAQIADGRAKGCDWLARTKRRRRRHHMPGVWR
jgi:hypothetical protein